MSHGNAPLSAGTQVRAADFPPAGSSTSDTTISGITATTYTVGVPEVAVRFMAPTSGRVALCVSGGIRNDSATTPADRLLLSYRVYVGDPAAASLLVTEDASTGISTAGRADATEDFAYSGHLTIVDGLIPGSFYYAQLRYRTVTGAGAPDLNYRSIIVFPIS